MNASKKIIIFGNSGSGKTTLSKFVNDVTGINRYEIDDIRWTSDWKRVSDVIFYDNLSKIKSQKNWIVDDGSKRTLKYFCDDADLIILVKKNVFICLVRLIKRSLLRWFKLSDKKGEPLLMAFKHWRHCLKYKFLRREVEFIRILGSNLDKVIFVEDINDKEKIIEVINGKNNND